MYALSGILDSLRDVKNIADYFYLRLTCFLVGASTGDKDGLRFLYEGDEKFSPIPTYGVLLAQEVLTESNVITGGLPGFTIDLSKVNYNA